MSFNPSRNLLNPKFEGYKFNPLSQEELVSRHGLPYRPTQASTSSGPPMSFQEVQSRIGHNHVSVEKEMAVYIDSDHRVVSIVISSDSYKPSFSVLYELPRPITSSSAAKVDTPRPEYPSAAFIDSSTLLISDGHGTMYILAIPEPLAPARLVSSYELRLPSYPSAFPFRIHHCARTSPTVAIVVVSLKVFSPRQAPSSERKSTPQFDILGIRIPIPPESTEEILPMDVIWHRKGAEVPIYTTYVQNSFALFGGSPYIESTSQPPPSYTPSPDELAPIPRKEENLDNNTPKPPPPYSWTQSPDSLTIAFPLPSSTKKTDIKVSFSTKTLSVLVSESVDNPSSISLPRYSLKALWGTILPSTSFWTWDKEGLTSFGLLTLHIDKQHDGTRWSQVFARNPESPETGVEETLDPSELAKISEALEKYTSSLTDDGSGLGLGSGISSLGKGEMDDELDASVGREGYLTQIRSSSSSEEINSDFSQPLTILSTPLPGTEQTRDEGSVVIKHGIDGLLCAASAPEEHENTWTHKSTFPALGFVLASKQDTRFTFHISSRAILAFESGSRGLGFNVYLYEAPSTPRAPWAKQSVLRIGDADSGPLMGVGAVAQGGRRDKLVILCLCEHELVVINGLPI